MPTISLREPGPADLDRCFEIETVSYQGDEAAGRDKIARRILTYPEGFVLLEVDGEIAGFVNSGATRVVDLANEAFKDLSGHDPQGPHVVILSVVVHPAYQGRGYADRLMTCFIARMRERNKTSIHLMCQTHLIPMYAKHGFRYRGPSESTHGGLRWYEMCLSLVPLCAGGGKYRGAHVKIVR